LSERRISFDQPRDDAATDAELPAVSIRGASATVEGFVEELTTEEILVQLLGGTLPPGEAVEIDLILPLGTVAASGVVRAVDGEGRVRLELTRFSQNGRLLLAAWLLQ
jgi:hypothetical protein